LEPTGRLIIIGTRWDYGDLYGYIMEEEAATFDVMIKKAYWENESGELEYLFPARLTPDFLKEMKFEKSFEHKIRLYKTLRMELENSYCASPGSVLNFTQIKNENNGDTKTQQTRTSPKVTEQQLNEAFFKRSHGG
jgi:hypothetical protein